MTWHISYQQTKWPALYLPAPIMSKWLIEANKKYGEDGTVYGYTVLRDGVPVGYYDFGLCDAWEAKYGENSAYKLAASVSPHHRYAEEWRELSKHVVCPNPDEVWERAWNKYHSYDPSVVVPALNYDAYDWYHEHGWDASISPRDAVILDMLGVLGSTPILELPTHLIMVQRSP